MNLVIMSGFMLLMWPTVVKCYTLKALRCGICRAMVDEMQRLIGEVRPTAISHVGSYRLDEKGNKMTKAIPLVRSDVFLSEALESVCKEMEEYARGYDKKTRHLRIVKMKMEGNLNPEMSQIDPISDADLNESLKFYCEDLTDEFEDQILGEFKKPNGPSDVFNSLCIREMNLCEGTIHHAEL